MSEILKINEVIEFEEPDINQILISTTESLQALAKITGETAKNVGVLSQQLKVHESEIEQLKFDEEITDQQSGTIREEAKRKVSTIVSPKGPYYGKFMSDIYRYLRNNHHLGSKINTTSKGNYDKVIEGIKNYNPDVNKIKVEHDQYLKQKIAYAKSLCAEDKNYE